MKRAIESLLGVALKIRGGVVTVPPGIRLFVDPHDPVERNVWLATHEPAVRRAMLSLLRPGTTVIDIGAYTGYYALLAARLVGTTGHVHAFEPVPESCKRIRENVVLNGLTNVTVNEAAVWEGSNKLHLTIPEGSYRSSAQPIVGRAMTVNAMRLDDYALELPNVAMLKIDVEGAELAVLRSGRRTLERHHPEILLELHVSLFTDPEREISDIMRVLEGADYSLTLIDMDEALTCHLYASVDPQLPLARLTLEELLAIARKLDPRMV